MSAIAQAQFLRIYTTSGTTLHRWQSYFSNMPVTLDGASWTYQPFDSTGITNGQTGDEGGVSITVPALPRVVDAVFAAASAGHLFELTLYAFTPAAWESRIIAARFIGQLINASGTITEMRIELGSALEPVGAQIPPRTMTTRLIGKGCRL